MTRQIRFVALALVFIPYLVSCNAYRGFASPGNSDEYIEEAQRCLADGDYACAVANYELLPAGDTKNEKLCIVNIARSGLSITDMLQTLTSTTASASSAVLGDFAEKLMPYTTVKETAAAASIGYCNAMASSQTQTMLRTLAYFVDCGIRIAKTDLFHATTAGGIVTCNSTTERTGDGLITQSDIGGDVVSGDLTGNPGMCQADVHACMTDLNTLQGFTLGSGLSALANSIAILSGLYNVLDDRGRANIRATMPN